MAIRFEMEDESLALLAGSSDDVTLSLHLEQVDVTEWWLQIRYGAKVYDIHLTSKRPIAGSIHQRST